MLYNRKKAVQFAKENIYAHNADYHGSDGGATSFVSRCLQSGFNSSWPAIADASLLYHSLIECGLADEKEPGSLIPGDIVQIKTSCAAPYKSLLVTGAGEDLQPLVSARAYVCGNRRLDSYLCHKVRCLHIKTDDKRI